MLTAQKETLDIALIAMQELFAEHWEELALDKDKVPLQPNYGHYFQREKAGEFLLVTLRKNGKLVGYFAGFVAPGLHYQSCLTLTMDIFWIKPADRNKAAGALKLFREVEREARRRGVQRIFLGSKLHKDAGRLFTALHYTPVETYYSKWIGD